jgi:hypothetical protein
MSLKSRRGLLKNLSEEVSKDKKSSKTLEKYESNLKRLTNNFNYREFDDKAPKEVKITYIYKNPEIVLSALKARKTKNDELFKETTIKSYIDSILHLFNSNEVLKATNPDIYKKWNEIYKEYKEETEKPYGDSKSNKKQSKAFLTYSQILRERDNQRALNAKDLGDSWYNHQNYLLLELITDIKPKRCELRKVFIINKGEDLRKYRGLKSVKGSKSRTYYKVNLSKSNYIEIDEKGKMTLYLHMFKTKKKYKEIKEELSSEMCNLINRSLERYPRKVLFGGQYAKSEDLPSDFKKRSKGEQYSLKYDIYPYETHDPYSKMFSRTFGKYFAKIFAERIENKDKRDEINLSPNIYRHIWLSDPQNIDFQHMSYDEKKSICDKLGTSVETANKMYLKIDYVEKNEEDGYDEKGDEESLEESK